MFWINFFSPLEQRTLCFDAKLLFFELPISKKLEPPETRGPHPWNRTMHEDECYLCASIDASCPPMNHAHHTTCNLLRCIIICVDMWSMNTKGACVVDSAPVGGRSPEQAADDSEGNKRCASFRPWAGKNPTSSRSGHILSQRYIIRFPHCLWNNTTLTNIRKSNGKYPRDLLHVPPHGRSTV